MEADDAALHAYYERGMERERLSDGRGDLEFTRTTEIVLRRLPAAPALFLIVEARVEAPLLPLRLFRLGIVAGSNAVGFLLGTSFLTFVFLGTLYMQQVLGFSALATGAAWMTASVVNTSQNFGAAIGVAVASSIAASYSHTLVHHGYATATAFTGGFQRALWVCGLTGLAAIPVAFVLTRRTGRS